MSEAVTVLVVDDNATNRKLVARLLDHEGYRVQEAADGAEALAMVRSGGPQLVISDILMPSMDGYEFVRQLRADPATAGLKVIFYTANYHEREALALARQVGVSRVLIKPCPAAELVRAVAEVLAGTAMEPPQPPDPGFDTDHLRLLTDKLSQNANTLRATNSRLAALTELNLQMASENNPRQLLHSVCLRARVLLGARYSLLAVAERQGGNGCLAFASGLPRQLASQLQDPRQDTGVLGTVFAQRKAQRLVSPPGQLLDLGWPQGFPEVRAALVVPVCSLTREYGWICLAEKLGAEGFDAEDERLLTILGAQLGRIYENGSLYREVQQQAARLTVEIEERERAAMQLRASEERFRELAEKIHDVFFVAGPDLLTVTYVSPGFEGIWGRSADAMLHGLDSWLETVHPDDRERVARETQQVLGAFPAEGELEFRILRPDESERWVQMRLFPVQDAQAAVVRTVGVMRDITTRKFAELRIERLNRTYALLSGINSLIVRATDRDTLLWDACRLAVDKGGFRGAWCGLVDAQLRELRPAAYAGDAEELAASVRIRIDEPGARATLTGAAMHDGKTRFCNDLLREDAGRVYRDQLLERGYRSLVALPLVVAGSVAGCLVLLSDVPGYFDDEELRLLEELAGDISFALDHIGKAEKLAFLASFDPLTGLANRSVFERRIGHYASFASHTRASFAVVVADLERFEALNNTLGRAAGDQILREVARRLVEAAGEEDIVGHMGADQFAVILSGVAVDSGFTGLLGQLLRRWLNAPFKYNGHVIELTAKAGVAAYPTDATSPDALLAGATAALRDAKDTGKAVGYYTRDLSERFAERMALEKDLRRALDHHEYELHYQPKVDLASRRVTGLEALIRWRRPQHGLVMPGSFIPLLEENGMIVEVGAWALRQACVDHARWIERGLAAPRVAVNVSAVQLRRDDFVQTISDAVNASGTTAALDIEVTESLLMEDVEDNLAKLRAVRDIGVGIALDDFGTGYSSLAYLAKLPVGVLKIDRSFVSAMLDDPGVTTLVSTIISLARSLRLETVAEGVEREEQAKMLHLLGCGQIQGYLISKPAMFEDIAGYLGTAGNTR